MPDRNILYPLGKLTEILMGQSPPSSSCAEVEIGLPFLQGNAEFTSRYPRNRLYCNAPTRICEEGDFLVSVRAPVGAVNEADKRYVIGRGLAAVRFPVESRRFGWHTLNFRCSELEKISQGSTFTAVGKKELEQLQVTFFSPGENSVIAQVLDTIDELIAKTEAVIAKLKQVRAGLLHDLLTRGLDENGELRDPVAHPEQFKDSPLGRIPKEWEVKSARDVTKNWDSKRIPLRQADRDVRKGEYPYYGASGVIDYVDDYLFDGSYLLIAEDGENLRSRELPVAFIATGKFWVNNHAHVLEPLPGTQLEFLQILFESIDYVPWLIGSAQPKLTQASLASIPLCIPLSKEQGALGKMVEEFDKGLHMESQNLVKLNKLKSGLMSDLLTGRVRVPAGVVAGVAAGVGEENVKHD